MRGITRLGALLAISGLTLGIAAGQSGPANAAAVATDPAMGMMIQVSSLAGATTPATLKTWLEDIRRDHRDSTKPGYVNSVVLQDIADANGVLYTPYLDVIAPYLPGGATPAFSQAAIGTVDLAWTGSGSKYLEGIENTDFRNRNVSVSVKAAQAFRARYPRATTSWYVTYEANLAGFWDGKISGAYNTYLSQLMKALSAVRPGAFLWSPAFWTMYADEPSWAQGDLKANLGSLFSGLPNRLSLSIQDFVGQSGGASTRESAAAWAAYLKRNWTSSLAAVQINAEQFTESASGAISTANASELPQRENYYRSQGIALGAAWEIRYWHARLYGR